MPFPYTLAFPTQVFLGKMTGSALAWGLTAQAAWTLIALGLAAVLWRGGLRRYTAFGV